MTDPTEFASKAIEALEAVAEELQHAILEIPVDQRACAVTIALGTAIEILVPHWEDFIAEHVEAEHAEEHHDG